MSGNSKEGSGLKTLEMGIEIMEFFARRSQPVRVTEVAKALGLPKARTHRYMTTLRDLGYLIQEESNDRYRTGWGLYILSQDVRHHFSFAENARPMIEAASRQIDLTVVLSTYSQSEFIVIDFVAPPSPLEMGLRPGSRFPLNCGAQGKIALAFGDEEIMKGFMSKRLPSTTNKSVVSTTALREEIARVRERGWADAPDELFIGVNAIAVPVFGNQGHLVASIAAVGMTSTLPSPPTKKILTALERTANRLSISLGSTRDPNR